MLRKCMVLLLAAVMLLSLVACGKEPQANPGPGDPGDGTSNPTGGTTGENTGSQPSGGEEAFDITKWGKEDKMSTRFNGIIADYFIRWPRYEGGSNYGGKVAEQLDDTVVVAGRQTSYAPAISTLPEAFATIKGEVIKTFKDYYGARSDSHEVTINNSEATTIGEHSMYVHKGTLSYKYNDEPREHQYVAYITLLPTNGAYAYWMVYDISEDQSKGDLIAQHAYRMALSFRLEE